ncbi:MAG TPA: 16S rRNA (cytosine(1402)-N(4))-methyltransferase RsmH [Candidatus Paceibacterota bacterium]
MHIPVLLQEVIENLAPKEGMTILDCTLGGGGHSKEICSRIGKKGMLIGLDQDEASLAKVREEMEKCGCAFTAVNENFRNLDTVLEQMHIQSVSGILFDLGLREDQLSSSGRGFSFRKDEPLIMTFSSELRQGKLTAYEVVNAWSEGEIGRILKEYGEERFARRIAKGIVVFRKNKPIQTTYDLVRIIEESTPIFYRKGRQHAARKTFQALRIAVNDELGALREGLTKAQMHVGIGGRIAVISFHSLEDRIVKHFFKDIQKVGNWKIITKKPIVPSDVETERNPLARSAKLRVIEKTH